MPVNQLRFEESSEIVIDSRSVTASGGWTLNYLSVRRIGASVDMHIEGTGGSAGAVCTLPADFAPSQTVTSPDGLVSVASTGVVSVTGTTLRNDFGWLAAQVSP